MRALSSAVRPGWLSRGRFRPLLVGASSRSWKRTCAVARRSGRPRDGSFGKDIIGLTKSDSPPDSFYHFVSDRIRALCAFGEDFIDVTGSGEDFLPPSAHRGEIIPELCE